VTTPEQEQSANGDSGKYFVPAIARALGVIEYLSTQDGPLGVTAIAAELGIAKSTCFSVLSTLETAGYVRRGHDQTWALTLKPYVVGTRVAARVDVLSLAKPVLEQLAGATQMTAHLALADDATVTYAQKVDAPGLIRFDTYPGKDASLHLTAVARAIAAHMDPDRLARRLESYSFEGGTARAVHDADEFRVRLARVRRLGYAFEDEEETEGVCCLAAPVFGADGSVRAAVGLAALTSQIRSASLDATAEQVKLAASTIGDSLGAALAVGSTAS
jgi:DNA-binding IclR family transcriptional regulator